MQVITVLAWLVPCEYFATFPANLFSSLAPQPTLYSTPCKCDEERFPYDHQRLSVSSICCSFPFGFPPARASSGFAIGAFGAVLSLISCRNISQIEDLTT